MTPMDIDSATDGYDWAKNASGSYTVAIRAMRLDMIKSGRAQPRIDDPDEVAAAREGGWIVDAQTHRVSA